MCISFNSLALWVDCLQNLLGNNSRIWVWRSWNFIPLRKKNVLHCLVSLHRGGEGSVLRRTLGNKKLNTQVDFPCQATGKGEYKKESQELFLFLKDKIQSASKIASCRKKLEQVSKLGRGDDFIAGRALLSHLQSRTLQGFPGVAL